MNEHFSDPELICIWPLKTPPTEDDLIRMADLSERLGRPLTDEEVMQLLPTAGKA